MLLTLLTLPSALLTLLTAIFTLPTALLALPTALLTLWTTALRSGDAEAAGVKLTTFCVEDVGSGAGRFCGAATPSIGADASTKDGDG